MYAHMYVHMCVYMYICIWLPWWLSGKDQPANAGDVGSIPGSGRSRGKGNGNPLQYSYLDRGDCWAIVHGVTKSQTQLSD